VHAAEHAVDADPGGRLGGAERRRVRAPGALQLDRRCEPAALRRVAGDEDDAVLDDVGVDALAAAIPITSSTVARIARCRASTPSRPAVPR
jgi:hypothetical protein